MKIHIIVLFVETPRKFITAKKHTNNKTYSTNNKQLNENTVEHSDQRIVTERHCCYFKCLLTFSLIGERISQKAIAQLIGDPKYLRF
jgi:hypothetical protein